jgi:hypothetical protein
MEENELPIIIQPHRLRVRGYGHFPGTTCSSTVLGHRKSYWKLKAVWVCFRTSRASISLFLCDNSGGRRGTTVEKEQDRPLQVPQVEDILVKARKGQKSSTKYWVSCKQNVQTIVLITSQKASLYAIGEIGLSTTNCLLVNIYLLIYSPNMCCYYRTGSVQGTENCYRKYISSVFSWTHSLTGIHLTRISSPMASWSQGKLWIRPDIKLWTYSKYEGFFL